MVGRPDVSRCLCSGFQCDGSGRIKGVNAEVKLKGQAGQGMVEYALILVLVSIVVIVILLTMGGQIQNVFSNVVAALNA